MKLLASCVFTLLLWQSAPLFAADDTSALQGKWTTKRTDDQGRHYSQTVEFKKDKFVFQITGLDSEFSFHAEGDVKLQKHGPFNTLRFFHIRAGQNAESMQPKDDEQNVIYALADDTWSVGMNFDEDHAREKPRVDVYQRAKPGANEGK